MAIIAFILVVIFTVINLRIYHKIFHVVYFNMGQALFREIFWSFFIAMFEAGVIITCIEPILNGVLKLLGILGKILLRNCREIICIFLESMLIYVMNEFSDSGGHFHGT